MGFDLSGCNPKINKELDDTTVYGMINSIESWDERWKIQDNLSEEEKNEYWQQDTQHHKDNPGVYFRANVWWWRPLWNYVCNVCDDILTEKDMEAGSYNDGRKISKTKAIKISKRLFKLLEEGVIDDYEEHYKKEQEIAAKSEDKDTRFFSQYPFSAECTQDFAEFCKQSGGFEIC